MDSETALQIVLALAMLGVLILVLWPKLACESPQAEQSCAAPKIRSARDSLSAAKVQLTRPRYSARVRQSYDQLFRLWLNPSSPPAEDDPDDRRAA